MTPTIKKFLWTDDEEAFLAALQAQVRDGECDMSSGELAALLELLEKYRKNNPQPT